MKFSDLQCKEVICLTDGRRLGFIRDAEVEVPSGKILSVTVPGPCRFCGLFGRRDDYCIPWDCICRIGPDLILADIQPDRCRVPREGHGLL